MDINTYQDSTNVLTATIFDPYESFYHLPINNATHCFINMFFDLCEIGRQKFETGIKGIKNIDEILKRYNEYITESKYQKKQYLKFVVRGTNEKEMIRWNTYIYKQIGIDNLKLFDPFNHAK